MSGPSRPLAGCRVGLSISESDESTRRGFPGWQVNRTTLQVVDTLFGVGAGVVFGHDWREDSVMNAVHGFASRVELVGDLSAEEVGEPLLVNLVPWPDRPHLSLEDRERLAPTLRVEEVGLPEELRAFGGEAPAQLPGEVFAYLRARALTHLRHRLDARSHARLCIGGRMRGYQGRYPGVVEEALIALQRGTPLYLAGVLGGAARQVIDAVQGREMPEDFCEPASVARLYARPPEGTAEDSPATRGDRERSPAAVWAAFREAGVTRLAERNGLTEAENEELFRTPVVDRAAKLVLAGLSRLHRLPRRPSR